VKISVQSGIVNDQFGDKSLKQTNENIRSEILKIQAKMYELHNKLQDPNEEGVEGSNNKQ
jgi:hypothetical protein